MSHDDSFNVGLLIQSQDPFDDLSYEFSHAPAPGLSRYVGTAVKRKEGIPTDFIFARLMFLAINPFLDGANHSRVTATLDRDFRNRRCGASGGSASRR